MISENERYLKAAVIKQQGQYVSLERAYQEAGEDVTTWLKKTWSASGSEFMKIGNERWSASQVRQLLFFVSGEGTQSIFQALRLQGVPILSCSGKQGATSGISSKWSAEAQEDGNILMGLSVDLFCLKSPPKQTIEGSLVARFVVPATFDVSSEVATLDVRARLSLNICKASTNHRCDS